MGANAQTTVPTFSLGQVLTADQMNQSARTGVPVFADTTARDAAFGGSGEKTLAEGQLCYLESTNVVQYYDGSSWATVGPQTAGGFVFVAAASFSAASAVNIDNVFTSSYRNYKMFLNYTTSGNNNITGQFRAGGVAATSNYNRQALTAESTTVAGARSTAAASMDLLGSSSDGSFISSSEITFFAPQVNQATNVIVNTNYNLGAYTGVSLRVVGFNHSTTAQYDGIGLAIAGGQTMTGHYAIYGMANS